MYSYKELSNFYAKAASDVHYIFARRNIHSPWENVTGRAGPSINSNPQLWKTVRKTEINMEVQCCCCHEHKPTKQNYSGIIESAMNKVIQDAVCVNTHKNINWSKLITRIDIGNRIEMFVHPQMTKGILPQEQHRRLFHRCYNAVSRYPNIKVVEEDQKIYIIRVNV